MLTHIFSFVLMYKSQVKMVSDGQIMAKFGIFDLQATSGSTVKTEVCIPIIQL